MTEAMGYTTHQGHPALLVPYTCEQTHTNDNSTHPPTPPQSLPIPLTLPSSSPHPHRHTNKGRQAGRQYLVGAGVKGTQLGSSRQAVGWHGCRQ